MKEFSLKTFFGCLRFECFTVEKFSPLGTQIFMGDFEEMRIENLNLGSSV